MGGKQFYPLEVPRVRYFRDFSKFEIPVTPRFQLLRDSSYSVIQVTPRLKLLRDFSYSEISVTPRFQLLRDFSDYSDSTEFVVLRSFRLTTSGATSCRETSTVREDRYSSDQAGRLFQIHAI
jgi:hypothetical protein